MFDKSPGFLQSSAHMKTTTLRLKHSMNCLSCRLALLISLALAGFALSPQARAVCQEGCLAADNTVLGENALLNNAGGVSNTAIGSQALAGNTTGRLNTAIGYTALQNSPTGSSNIALGAGAGMKLRRGSNNIDIGSQGNLGDSNTIRIGTEGFQTTTYIAGISGSIVADGVGVIVDSEGHLGTVVSSERYKDDIKPMDKASEAILALKPVTFHYKKELDPESIPQFGLVAELVEKVDPDLVVRDNQGKPYTVRYEAVNAMLLNEFLKEHRKVEALEASVAVQRKDFESQIAALTAALKAQAAQIQTVNDQLRAQAFAPRVVAND
jgi:Chaperone of endosialidase